MAEGRGPPPHRRATAGRRGQASRGEGEVLMARVLPFKARRLIMRSCLLFGSVTLSLAALAPPAGADWHRIEFPPVKGELGVIDGKVWVVSAPKEPCTWHLIRGAQAGHIQVLEPREWKGRRLAY